MQYTHLWRACVRIHMWQIPLFDGSRAFYYYYHNYFPLQHVIVWSASYTLLFSTHMQIMKMKMKKSRRKKCDPKTVTAQKVTNEIVEKYLWFGKSLRIRFHFIHKHIHTTRWFFDNETIFHISISIQIVHCTNHSIFAFDVRGYCLWFAFHRHQNLNDETVPLKPSKNKNWISCTDFILKNHLNLYIIPI